MRHRLLELLNEQQPEDWACVALLISLALFLLLSERFWIVFPF